MSKNNTYSSVSSKEGAIMSYNKISVLILNSLDLKGSFDWKTV